MNNTASSDGTTTLADRVFQKAYLGLQTKTVLASSGTIFKINFLWFAKVNTLLKQPVYVNNLDKLLMGIVFKTLI